MPGNEYDDDNNRKQELLSTKKKKPPATANPDAARQLEERNRAQTNGLLYDDRQYDTVEEAEQNEDGSKYLHSLDERQYDTVEDDEQSEDGYDPVDDDEEEQAAAPVAAAPVAAAPVAATHNRDPFGLGQGPLTTMPMLEKYRGEHRADFDPQGHLPTEMTKGGKKFDVTNTRYATGPEAHRATVQDGKLHGAGGAVADSGDVKRMYVKDKHERLNFAMDGHGSTYLSDPRAETMANFAAAEASGTNEIERINHTTMVGGGDVAGAGTVRIRDGKVETLGDGSGHYAPTITQTAQVASTMAAQGVLDPARASIELVGKGETPDGDEQKELTISAQELLSYGEGKDDPFAAAKQAAAENGQIAHQMGQLFNGEDPAAAAKTAAEQEAVERAELAAPEAQIRQRHAVKDRVLAQLRATTPEAEGSGAPAPAPAPVYSEVPDLAAKPAPTVYSEVPDLAAKPAPTKQPVYSWPNTDKRKRKT